MPRIHPFSASPLTAALSLALLCAFGGAFANEPYETTASADAVDSTQADPNQADSSQPASDAWITTKVKAELLASPDASGLKIDVDTVNGVVSLSGEVGSQAEIDKAVEIAKGIKGVKSVDTTGLSVAISE